MHLEAYPNQNSPTDSAEEAINISEGQTLHFTVAFCHAKKMPGLFPESKGMRAIEVSGKYNYASLAITWIPYSQVLNRGEDHEVTQDVIIVSSRRSINDEKELAPQSTASGVPARHRRVRSWISVVRRGLEFWGGRWNRLCERPNPIGECTDLPLKRRKLRLLAGQGVIEFGNRMLLVGQLRFDSNQVFLGHLVFPFLNWH